MSPIFSLPFGQENSAALGIIAKAFLCRTGKEKESLSDLFPACTDPTADLKRGLQFWGEIVLLVKELAKSELVPSATAESFAAADHFLKSKRKL